MKNARLVMIIVSFCSLTTYSLYRLRCGLSLERLHKKRNPLDEPQAYPVMACEAAAISPDGASPAETAASAFGLLAVTSGVRQATAT